jgi:pyroglutamyl-peptidase
MAQPVILLTGFEPFGGEHENPSWEIGRRFEGKRIEEGTVKTLKLPVKLKPALRIIADQINRLAPIAVIGMGQAGGRPAITIERIAINLFSGDEAGGGAHRSSPMAPMLT